MTKREIIEEIFDLQNRQGRVRESFERHVSEKYIQHNPLCRNGWEDAIALIEKIVSTPGFHASLERVIVEGDFAVVHLNITFAGNAPDLAVVDIMRFEGDKIAEHWDVMQEVPLQTASGNTMF